MTADGDVSEYATGFTNIIDLGFGPDGTLYVAEIVHAGLMDFFAAGGVPAGAVLSVPPGGGASTILVSDERVLAHLVDSQSATTGPSTSRPGRSSPAEEQS